MRKLIENSGEHLMSLERICYYRGKKSSNVGSLLIRKVSIGMTIISLFTYTNPQKGIGVTLGALQALKMILRRLPLQKKKNKVS